MLNVLNQLPILLVCGIFGITLCCIAPVRSAAAFLYRWLCWLLHFPLDLLRRFLRWFNWEKVSMFTLAGSLILVTVLTVAVRWGQAAIPDEGIDTGIYEALRIVFAVFEGDSATFRDYLIGSPCAAGGGFWAWILVALAYALPVTVPISAMGTAVTLLWNHLPHHVPIFSRNWYVFSELDANSIRMARSINEGLKQEKDTGVFIFLRTRRNEQTSEILDDLRGLNYCLYPKNEARFLLWHQRRFRRLRFFFLSEKTDENFERMQDFLNAAKEKELFRPVGTTKNDVFQQELYLLSETESAPMLIEHLRKIPKTSSCFQNTELQLLDRFRATSYDLLREKPLYDFATGNGRLNVLVLGFGKIGREFFRTACSLGILPGCRTEFTLCDQQIGSKLNLFLTQCPELHKSVTIHPRKLNVDTAALDQLIKANNYHYILVALGDDERNIRIASRLKRFYRLRHWEFVAGQRAGDPQPQICVNIEDSIKHKYTEGLWDDDSSWGHALHVFGGLDQVFTRKVLMPQPLWAAARYIHRELNRKKGSPTLPPEPPKPLVWSEYERRSSIACAVRAEYLYNTICKSDPTKDYHTLIRGHLLYELASTEHLRWMAYVRSEGLRYGSTALVDAYYGNVKGGHVDILGKLTPCLVNTTGELANVWKHLKGKYSNDYQAKRSFREHDKFIVKNAAIIAEIAKTGEIPDSNPAT